MVKWGYFSNDSLRRIYTPAIAVILLSLALIPFVGSAEADVPFGFSDTLIAQGLSLPTAMEVAPDGRIFVSEKCGDLQVIKNGVLLAQPFVSISVECNGFEIGLIGIAFDPNFVSNGYVYVFYTTSENSLHNRVSRFTADPSNPNIALAGSEFILLDTEPVFSDSHMSGAIEFGPDGTLFIASGDNYQSHLAPDLTTRFGKILRINSDGTIPSDNPFVGVPGAYPEIWAYGLRNPFTFQISSTGTMHIADVGQDDWEEINVGIAGANYGWPTCEGACSPPNPQFVDPLYSYANLPGDGASVIAGPFYEATQFPSAYQDSFFFADYVQDWIKRLTPTNQVVDFASNVNAPVAMELAPDGSLYYLSIFPGEVHQITYDLANNFPNAVATANPSSGLSPLFVTFDGSLSSDLDLDPLTYSWDFGDGSPAESGVLLTHTYGSVGSYTAVLTVDDGKGGVDTGSVLISVGNPPIATIDTPAAGTFYNAGTTISYSGSATDTEDGTLPASAYEWTIVFHHNIHTHPYLQFSGITSGSFDIDTLNETDPDVWYRIILTVTDSDGLTHTTFQDVLPNTVNLTIDTNPTGLQILVDSQPYTAPYSVEGVVGVTRTLGAFASQILNGDIYDYDSWSDGGAIVHTILTPATDTAYTATYVIIPDVTAPVVSANPTGGTFVGSVDVTLSATDEVDPSPTIYYTTDGSPATTGSPVYTSLITITTDTTLNFIATDSSGNVSLVGTESYVITIPTTVTLTIEAIDSNGFPKNMYNGIIVNGTTIATGFTPASYQITTGIEYTAFVADFNQYIFDHWEDGSTDSSRIITLIQDTTITAFMLDTITGEIISPVVSASPTAGTLDNGQDTSLTTGWNNYVSLVPFTNLTPGSTIDSVAMKIENPSGNIRYKVYLDDGAGGDPSTLLGQTNSIPAQAGTVYNSLNSPVTVPSSGTIWVGFEPDSSAMSAYYDTGTRKYILHTFGDGPDPFGSTGGTSTFANWAGIKIGGANIFLNSVNVTLSATDNFDPSPTIHYTTDGTTPTTSSTVYTGPIFITADTTLNFIATDSSGNVSLVGTESYVITTPDVTAPVVSANPTGGTFSNEGEIFLTATDDVDPSPTIYYTTDGTTPTTSSTVYAGPFFITTDTTVSFLATDSSGNVSLVVTEVYVITTPDVTAPVVSANPTSGTFYNSVDVTLSATDDTDPSPTIYYTTDGSTPTTSSTVYTSLITITADTTLSFIATDSSGNTSAVSTENYVITVDVTAPVVSANPTSGTFINSVDVTLSAIDAVDPSPTIYYTQDGSTPTTASPVYTTPITFTFPVTLSFMAADAAGNTSPVSTENYVITLDVPPPVIL